MLRLYVKYTQPIFVMLLSFFVLTSCSLAPYRATSSHPRTEAPPNSHKTPSVMPSQHNEGPSGSNGANLRETKTPDVSTPRATPIVTLQATTTDDGLGLELVPAGASFLFSDRAGSAYYLQNIRTGETRTFIPSEDEFGESNFYTFMYWSNNACELVLWDEKIIRMNLQGEVLEEIFSFESITAAIREVVHHPVENKFAFYAVGRFYDPDDGYRGQYLEVVDLANPAVHNRLSENNGGERMMKWSPDGKWLAYAEYDENNILQVILSSSDGVNRKQLTSFTEANYLVNLTWSPDGQRITFASGATYEGPFPQLFLISDLMDEPYIDLLEWEDASVHWWQDANTLVILLNDLVWMDVQTLQIIHNLERERVPDQSFWRVQPFPNSHLIGFVSYSHNTIAIYDPITDELTLPPKADLTYSYNLESWYPGPLFEDGNAACLP